MRLCKYSAQGSQNQTISEHANTVTDISATHGLMVRQNTDQYNSHSQLLCM